MMENDKNIKAWRDHKGLLSASNDNFDVIDCENCKFKHIIPIPTVQELDTVYQHDYYNKEKPLYLDQYKEDIDWWNLVYSRRYDLLEKYLLSEGRDLLDIGSGPGYFLLNGRDRGWRVMGMEPSNKAAEHSRTLGLDVLNEFYSKETASKLNKFDAVNISLVLEHIPNPAEFLRLIRSQLNKDGLISIVVPNDFNSIQLIARDGLSMNPWWVAPPHHINYFNFESLACLLAQSGFELVHRESTFPIDIFLLMGDNYISNQKIGRESHVRRMNFEKNVLQFGGSEMLEKLYNSFASQGLGREVVMIGRAV